MAGEKNINLMPEDLRIKESEQKFKKKNIFQVDLVVPGGQKFPSSVKKGASIWSKLGGIFKRPPHFGDATHRSETKVAKEPDKHKEHHKKEEKKIEGEVILHIPKKENKEEAKINYTEIKTDFKLPAENEQKDKKEHKASWWSKLFARKPKKDKSPKITRAEEKPILPRELPQHQPEESKIENRQTINLMKDPEVAIPEVSAPVIQDIKPIETSVEIDTNVDDVMPTPDFSLPNELVKPTEVEPKEETKNDKNKDHKKIEISKFHKPEPRIRAKFLDDGGGVDLIPTAAKTRSWRQVVNLLIVALLGSTIIVGIFYVVLFFQSEKAEQEKRYTAQQISDIEKQILEYENINREIDDLGNEIRLVNDLLTKHLYWTDFFNLLEKYTISEVYYHGFSSGNGGSLTLSAVAPDFNSVARQLKVLQQEEAKEFVTDVIIMSAAAGDVGVEFDMVLVLNDNLFSYDSLEGVAEQVNEGEGQ